MNIPLRLVLHTLLATLLLSSTTLAIALSAKSKSAVDLTGRWNINTASSDDAEALLAHRLEEERRERRRWQERERARTPLEQLDEEVLAPPISDPRISRERRNEREAEFKRMLGVTKFLEIEQSADGGVFAIRSDVESRKFQAGSRSQVSMPESQLADATSGWEGEWFVIERNVRKGPRVIERYRRLKKTDQLESTIAWKGDTLLAGIKVHRIFDRAPGTAPPPDPDGGPVR